LWSVEGLITTAPAAGDSLVFTGGDGSLQALAQTDGAMRWRIPIEGSVTSVYWNSGWLLVTTDMSVLLALRAGDGAVVWRRDLGSALQNAPAPDGDRLYLSLKNGAVLAMAMQTGDQIWTKQLLKPGGGILAVGDRVYFGSQEDLFYCISAKDGKTIWRWKTGGDVIGTPAIDAKRVYYVASDNVLRALDRRGGSVGWQKSLPVRPSIGPVLTGWTILIAGTVAELHGYSTESNGAELGDLKLRSAENQETQLAAPPHLTTDDMLVLVTKGGQMQGWISSPAPYGP